MIPHGLFVFSYQLFLYCSEKTEDFFFSGGGGGEWTELSREEWT